MGCFVTASDFTGGFKEFASNSVSKIILIGCNQLADLLVDEGRWILADED